MLPWQHNSEHPFTFPPQLVHVFGAADKVLRYHLRLLVDGHGTDDRGGREGLWERGERGDWEEGEKDRRGGKM